MAITDHDTVDGVVRAAPLCRERGIVLIPAIELSSTYHGRSMDLLGYGIDPTHPGLVQALDSAVRERRMRIPKMIARLRAQGIELSEEDVYALAPNGVVGRPHVALALVNRGAAADVADAFERYLVRGKAGFVPKENLPPEKAIQLINSAGGLAVLAHPRYLKMTEAELNEALDRLMAAGLAGLEVYYSQHTAADVQLYDRIAQERGLLVTGGSDFHGQNKPHIPLGAGPKGKPLPRELAENLLEAIERRRSGELKGRIG